MAKEKKSGHEKQPDSKGARSEVTESARHIPPQTPSVGLRLPDRPSHWDESPMSGGLNIGSGNWGS